MSASSSFPTPAADTRPNKWKKRKTDSNLKNPSKKQQRLHDDDEEEEEEEDPTMEEEDDDNEENEDFPAGATGPAAAQNLEAEILSDSSSRICGFPSVVKHTVNRLHPYVLALAAADRSVSDGGSSGMLPRNAVFLENISHGQIQALSVVPAGSPALAQPDHDRSDGPVPTFVYTPPPIMEGNGVVKRFGSHCQHVVPMHAG